MFLNSLNWKYYFSSVLAIVSKVSTALLLLFMFKLLSGNSQYRDDLYVTLSYLISSYFLLQQADLGFSSVIFYNYNRLRDNVKRWNTYAVYATIPFIGLLFLYFVTYFFGFDLFQLATGQVVSYQISLLVIPLVLFLAALSFLQRLYYLRGESNTVNVVVIISSLISFCFIYLGMSINSHGWVLVLFYWLQYLLLISYLVYRYVRDFNIPDGSTTYFSSRHFFLSFKVSLNYWGTSLIAVLVIHLELFFLSRSYAQISIGQYLLVSRIIGVLNLVSASVLTVFFKDMSEVNGRKSFYRIATSYWIIVGIVYFIMCIVYVCFWNDFKQVFNFGDKQISSIVISTVLFTFIFKAISDFLSLLLLHNIEYLNVVLVMTFQLIFLFTFYLLKPFGNSLEGHAISNLVVHAAGAIVFYPYLIYRSKLWQA